VYDHQRGNSQCGSRNQWLQNAQTIWNYVPCRPDSCHSGVDNQRTERR